MAVDVGSAVGYLDLDISGFLAGLKSAQSEADKQSKNIAETVGNNISGIGKKLSSAGSTLTKSITIPVASAGTVIAKLSSDFESAMSKVQAISGASGDDLIALTEKAKELGATTAWSASEVAEGMTEMAKAGWTSQQIIDGMGGVLDAASASGESLANTATIVADAITGFGLEAKESTRIADLLTQAANAGTIDIADLGESFKYIAPVAQTMGFSVEDVTTAISAMSMAGIKGSQAGTSLRTMLTRMVKPTDEVASAMDELGIVLTNEDGSFKSLNTIVSEMRGSFDGLTDEQKTFYATTLAGQEGMSGLLSLLNLSSEEYNAISDSMENAGGTAKETADVMLNNLSGQITIMKSALEGLVIQFGEIILPYFKQFVEWLQKMIQKFSELSPEQKEQIVKWAAIAAAIGPVLLVAGKVISVFGGIISAMAKLGGAIAGISAPVIAVVAVIAVLVAAFVSLWKNNEEFRNKIIAIWEQIKATFEKLTSGIVERLNRLGFDFESIGEVLKSIWKGLCDFLAPYFEGVFNYISIVFETFVNVFLGVWDFFHALFTGDWQGCWDAIKNIFESIWNGIKDWFINILNVLKDMFDVVLGWFGTSWSETWNKIKTFFVNIWNNIKLTASNVWNGIKTTASDVWNGIKNAIAIPINAAKTIISNVVNSIKSTISSGFNTAKNTVSSVFNSIKNTISNVLNSAKNTVKNAINKIKGFFNFSWSLPKLKMPHFSITGSFSLFPPSVPKVSVDWYKKAMGNGVILDTAAIFGFNPKTGKFLGGGEAGSETVVGTKSLLAMIRQTVAEAIGPLIQASRELARASADLGYVTYNGFTKLKEAREKQDGDGQSGNGDGDTFIFYSPKAIDEIEAAKQMKRAKRDLAEEF